MLWTSCGAPAAPTASPSCWASSGARATCNNCRESWQVPGKGVASAVRAGEQRRRAGAGDAVNALQCITCIHESTQHQYYPVV